MERFISFNNIYSEIKGLGSASADLAKSASSFRIAGYVFFCFVSYNCCSYYIFSTCACKEVKD